MSKKKILKSENKALKNEISSLNRKVAILQRDIKLYGLAADTLSKNNKWLFEELKSQDELIQFLRIKNKAA